MEAVGTLCPRQPFSITMGAFLLHLITVIAMSVPTVLAYNLVFGKGKILHFGQLAFSIVGGYALWVTVGRYGYGIFPAFLFALVVISVTSLLFAWLSLRLPADAFGVLSIAVHLMVLAIVLNWQSVTRGALGVPNLPRPFFATTPAAFAIMSIAIAIAWTLLIWKIDSGRFGRSVAALSEHSWYAMSLGIERGWVHTVLFLLAGIGALLVNFMYHSYLHLLSPSDFSFSAMIFYVMVVVAGAPGSLWGSLISLTLLTFLREGIRFLPIPNSLTGPMELMLFGVILFVAVWYRRDSLFPKQRTV